MNLDYFRTLCKPFRDLTPEEKHILTSFQNVKCSGRIVETDVFDQDKYYSAGIDCAVYVNYYRCGDAFGYVYKDNFDNHFFVNEGGGVHNMVAKCVIHTPTTENLLPKPVSYVGAAQDIKIKDLYNLDTSYGRLHPSYKWALSCFKPWALEAMDENGNDVSAGPFYHGGFSDSFIYRLRRPKKYVFNKVQTTYSYKTEANKKHVGTVFRAGNVYFFASTTPGAKLKQVSKIDGEYEIGEPFWVSLEQLFKDGEHPIVEAQVYA